MKFSKKDFFSKSDQIRSFLRIWSHLLKKSLMENFIFCAVKYAFADDPIKEEDYSEHCQTSKKIIINSFRC